MKAIKSLFAIVAGLMLLSGAVPAQKEEKENLAPQPVPGTEMVETEYGQFPREIVWPKDGSVMVLIPHGTFERGLAPENGGAENETPVKEIYIPSFYIDKYEISNAQYLKFLQTNPHAFPRPTGNEKLKSPDHPVVAISWDSAVAYAEWAGKQLPTEAMWEKAARGPENTVYTTGSELPGTDTVIYGRDAGDATIPVTENTGDISGYGVFHMGGNASEWIADWYTRAAYQLEETENPQGPEIGDSRVIRGASFFSKKGEVRATYRNALVPSHIRDTIGFRTVWIPQEPVPEDQRPTPTPSPTPEPTREEIVAELTAQILPYLNENAPKLPKEMMAGRVYTNKNWNPIQIVNFTPYNIKLNAVGPNERLIYKYNEPIPAMTYRNVSLPRERDLCLVAIAPDAPRSGPITLGCLRAESFATMVIKSEMLSPVTTAEGEVLPMDEPPQPELYYTDFKPIWNEMEIHNSLSEPILVKLDDITVSSENPLELSEFSLEADSILRIKLRPGKYRFTPQYFGALDESSTPAELSLDDKAARRLLTIEHDPNTDQMVTVITTEKPYLHVRLIETQSLPLPRNQITKNEQ